MSTAVSQLLKQFDALTPTERHDATIEILRRESLPQGDLPEETLLQAAESLFLALDQEESHNAAS